MNALGIAERTLLVPHSEYLLLGADAGKHQAAYRTLFKTSISEKTLEDIRESTNKSWVLGSDRFKAQIEAKRGGSQHRECVVETGSRRNSRNGI